MKYQCMKLHHVLRFELSISPKGRKEGGGFSANLLALSFCQLNTVVFRFIRKTNKYAYHKTTDIISPLGIYLRAKWVHFIRKPLNKNAILTFTENGSCASKLLPEGELWWFAFCRSNYNLFCSCDALLLHRRMLTGYPLLWLHHVRKRVGVSLSDQCLVLTVRVEVKLSWLGWTRMAPEMRH